MAHVSLILTAVRADPPGVPSISAACRSLEAAGHTVEVVVAVAPEADPGSTRGPAGADPDGPRDLCRVASEKRGRTAAAVAGLRSADGEVLVILDPDRGYAPEDVVRLVGSIDPTQPEMAVASRLERGGVASPVVRPKAYLGSVLRVLTGSSDPLSGLVALSRPALEAASGELRDVGSQFALELLTKVRCRRIDVPSRPTPGVRRLPRPGFDDLRHLKHLADHRFGNVSRLMQFCAVGASGMVVDLSCYALFQELFFRVDWLASNPVPPTRVPFALALARGLAIGVALVWNFSLNRRMTFNYARAGSIPRQFVAYVLSNLLGITVSMLLSLGLPSRVPFFADHKLLAALVGIVAATGISFSMARWLVFRRIAPQPGTPAPGLGARSAPLDGLGPGKDHADLSIRQPLTARSVAR